MGGDARVRDLTPQSVDANQDKAGAKLRDDAYRPGRDGSDKTSGTTVAGPHKFDDPYEHMSKAAASTKELADLANKKGDEKISVRDAAGNVKEVTVAERRAQLVDDAGKEFERAVKAADNIDQNKVSSTLAHLRQQIAGTSDKNEKAKLQDLESVVEAMKHAPSVTRFGFATFLNEGGEYVKAKQLLQQAAKDPEAKHDKTFQQISKEVDDQISKHQGNATVGENPFEALKSADDKRKAGDLQGAEADYKKAIDQADKLNGDEIAKRLRDIDQAKKDNANNPKALEDLNGMEQGLASLAHAPAIARLNYADFLNQQKRYDEALPILMTVAKSDPDLVKDDKEFARMVTLAQNKGKDPEPFDDPFAHLGNFKDKVQKGDLTGGRDELVKAVSAADKIDRKMMENNIKVIDEQLKDEKDPAKVKALQDMKSAYDQLDHAAAMTRIALCRFDIADKNYSSAQFLLKEAQQLDPDFVKRPEIELSKLQEDSQEPSTWQKAKDFAKGALKELSCDAVAILAGAGAAIATGWSGPGAVGVGALAGGAAYTGMKALWGDEIHWYTPLWGALDGATGGTAALARTALVRAGGAIVSKEMAAAAVTKAGGEVAALEGLEGMKMAQTAEVLTKAGLKNMAKDVPFWSRQLSKVPLIGAGDTEFRTALAAYRGLKYANLGTKLVVDAGTVAAGSAVYQAGHQGYNYYKGDYNSLSDFASHYVRAVGKDTLVGTALLGPTGVGSLFNSARLTPFVLSQGALVGPAADNFTRYEQAKQQLAYLQKPVDLDDFYSRASRVHGTSDIHQVK